MAKNSGGVDLIGGNLTDYSTPLNKALLDATGLVRDYRDVSIAGTGSYTLSLDDATPEGRSPVVRFTGTLTGTRTVLWPASGGSRVAVFWNNTTGSFTATVKTDQGGSTGVAIPQGYALILFHDGANVYAAGPAFAPQTNVTSGAWTAVTFSGTWVNYGAPFQTVQYRKIGDRVELRGTAKLGTALSTLFTLPTGYRPPADLVFPMSSNAAFGAITVTSAGAVTQSVGSNASVTLDGIFFSVTT
ncbi:MAG TPA: hypothetical protein VF297_05280 [Pyrinomonadaceae bacterium]